MNFIIPTRKTYTRFENGCSENSTQKLLTKYSTEENNKHVICRPRSVRIGKNCALGLDGCTQDLWYSFPQYGPPGRQKTYMYFHVVLFIMLYKVVLTFKSVDETLVCNHSNEGSLAALSSHALYC